MHIFSISLHLPVRTRLVFWWLPLLQNSKRNSLSGGVNTWRWEKSAIFDRNRRISQKWYEIGPRLVWITNRKSRVADRFVSVPMTLKAGWGIIFFRQMSDNYTRVVWPRMTEFGMVVQVVEKRVGQLRPHAKEPGRQRPPIFWDPYWRPHDVTKFCKVTHVV